ncbi:hypothetical protein WH96_20800, partial [Kiloniella spongiae]
AQTSSTTTVAGSLEGEFAVDDSGAATYSLPISVSPGIAGNEPRLALSYSSQTGNGPLGVGWGLSGLSPITRCGQRLVPHGKIHGVDFSNEDRFCLDGQRLVAVSGDYGADGTEYRTEIESYAKVISNGTAGTGPESFTVWSKGGLVLEYGVTDDSRIEAIKADGTARSEARIWALNKQSDRSGNAITYSYTEDQSNGSYRINRIDYGGNATAGTAATSSVRFVYEDRTDIRTWYQAGAKITQDQRLKNIQTYEAETLVADYRVEFDNDGLLELSKLSTITQCSADACLQPITIEYLENTVSEGYQPFIHFPGSSGSWSSYKSYFHDVDGDGLTDLTMGYFGTSGVHTYTFIAKGDGHYEPYVHFPGGGGNWSSYKPYFHDVNGDGLTDLIMGYFGTSGVHTYTFISKGDGYYEPYVHFPGGGGDWSSYKPYFHDVNGDGLADLMMRHIGSAGINIFTFLSKGDGSFQNYKHFSSGGDWSAYTPYFHDVNGDGNTDMLALSVRAPLHVFTFMSKGDGSFQNYKHFSSGGDWSAYTPYFHDVNGDTLTDLIMGRFGVSGIDTFAFLYNSKKYPSLLNKITTSRGHETSISYTPLTDKFVYSKGSGAVYPEQDYVSPLSVVQSVERDDGIGGKRKIEYSYAGAKVDVKRGSFLGFKQITSKDMQRETETITDYRQDWPFV